MSKYFKSKTVLKLFSVVLAVLMWFYVVRIENPQFDVTVYNVPYTLTNSAVLFKAGLVVTEASSDTVTVRLHGKRQSVIALKAEDLNVTLDVGTIEQPGVYSLTPKVTAPEDGISVTAKDPRSVTLTVEAQEQRTFPVTPTVSGKPKDGYFAAPAVVYQKEITVQAPTELLDQIKEIRAELTLNGEKKDVERQAPLQIVDQDGNFIVSELVVLSDREITVRCPILPTKEVPVQYTLTGTLKFDGYEPEKAVPSVEKLRIAGEKEALDELSAVSLGEVDLSAMTEKKHKAVLPVSLDDGLYSADGINEVTVEVLLKKSN